MPALTIVMKCNVAKFLHEKKQQQQLVVINFSLKSNEKIFY